MSQSISRSPSDRVYQVARVRLTMSEDRLHARLIESVGQPIEELQPVGYVLGMTGQSTASGL